MGDLEMQSSKSTPTEEITTEDEIVEIVPVKKEKENFYQNARWDLNFRDGVRRIDVVVAFKKYDDDDERLKTWRRDSFLGKLEEQGLEMEIEAAEEEDEGEVEGGGEKKKVVDPGAGVTFVKIHAPFDVVSNYAELLKVQVPLHPRISNQHKGWMSTRASLLRANVKGILSCLTKPLKLNEQILPSKVNQLMETYTNDKKYLFDLERPDRCFPPIIRSRIVNYILRRTEYLEKPPSVHEEGKEEKANGISKLVADGVFTAVYPLHEGEVDSTRRNKRQVLSTYWSSWTSLFKMQPLDYIRDYFGERIAFYFGWLEFYILMLIPASIVGIIVFIYGMSHWGDDIVSDEICNPPMNITLCPLCEKLCKYVDLRSGCLKARASRIFDNSGTLFFAIFMSLWTTFFVELWKRQQCKLQFRWHQMMKYQKEDSQLRPEYVNKLHTWNFKRSNKLTGEEELYYPFYRMRVPAFCLSFAFIFFMICCSIAAVLGVVVYRVAVQAAIAAYPDTTYGAYLRRYRSLIISASAACINLVIIFVLNFIYRWVSAVLTELENFKTQADHDASLHFKIYLLQFINFYSSLVYIAFIKGKLPDTPRSNKAFIGFQQEECDVGGCFIELTIQLIIIMVGKNLIQGVVIEYMMPTLIAMIKGRFWKERGPKPTDPSWKKDFYLTGVKSTGFVFDEYLELVIQFGFVTLFVAAFPLAPLVALINNILEVRVDANKLLHSTRRPFAVPARNIGVWMVVLESLASLTVLVNACIIAFTTEVIPRALYQFVDSGTGFGATSRHPPAGNLTGYVASTLSRFDVADYRNGSAPDVSVEPTPPPGGICYYSDYRYGPEAGDSKYFPTAYYWEIWGMRFIFVVAFQNSMIWAKNLFSRWISDTPNFVKNSLRHERRIIDGEIMKRAKSE